MSIGRLNDEFRRALAGGHVVMTDGVAALPTPYIADVLIRVHTFEDFTVDNDPHGEHDFGAYEHQGDRYFWKIAYYDRDLRYGSPDPADSTQTSRVLTIMLAEEY